MGRKVRNQPKKAKSIPKAVTERAKSRKQQLENLRNCEIASWQKVDLEKQSYRIPYISEENETALTNVTKATSAFEIFDLYLPEHLLREIWDSYPYEHWDRGSDGMLLHGEFNLKAIYVYLAVYVWIMANPEHDAGEGRPLRRHIDEALNSFRSVAHFDHNVPHTHSLEQLFAKYHLSADYFDEISQGFRKAISKLGRTVAGDEKLFHFTGDSAFVRLVLSKPDRVGFWFYELTTKLKDGKPYLLDTFLCKSNKGRKINETVLQIVQKWSGVLDEYDTKDSILVFDNYYASNDSVDYLVKNHYDFVCGINPARFQNLVSILNYKDGYLSKRGESSAIYSESKNELFVHHYDMNANLGKKYVLSDAFHESPRTRSDDAVVPVYDHYSQMFNICDLFNKGLYKLSFKHKCGGGGSSGEEGHCQKFIIACVVKNMLNLFHNVENSKYRSMNFQQLCVALSKEIFLTALTL